MIPDELLAAVSECEHADVPALLGRIESRVGRDSLIAAFFARIAEGAEPGAERPRFLRAGAFLQAVGQPPPMLIDRLVPERSLILLTGKPKLGKSFLGMDIADAVCRGLPVFGEFTPARCGPVLYLGMEDGKYEIANRMLGRGIRAGDDRPLYICPERFTITTVEGMALLREMVAAAEGEAGAEPVLLIIDTARESLGIKEWNDQAEVSDKVRPLRELAREKLSVFLIAHNRKADAVDPGDEIAGSGAFASSVDGWISDRRVEKLPSNNRRHYLSVLGRGNMAGEYVVEMDTHTYRFRYVTDAEVAQQGRDSRHRAVAAAIRACPGATATVAQIVDNYRPEITFKVARELVNEMLDAGFLEQIDTERRSGAGRPASVYRLTELISSPYISIGEVINSGASDGSFHTPREGRF